MTGPHDDVPSPLEITVIPLSYHPGDIHRQQLEDDRTSTMPEYLIPFSWRTSTNRADCHRTHPQISIDCFYTQYPPLRPLIPAFFLHHLADTEHGELNLVHRLHGVFIFDYFIFRRYVPRSWSAFRGLPLGRVSFFLTLLFLLFACLFVCYTWDRLELAATYSVIEKECFFSCFHANLKRTCGSVPK